MFNIKDENSITLSPALPMCLSFFKAVWATHVVFLGKNCSRNCFVDLTHKLKVVRLDRASSYYLISHQRLASLVRYMLTRGNCSNSDTFAVLKYWSTSQRKFPNVLALRELSKGDGSSTFTRERPSLMAKGIASALWEEWLQAPTFGPLKWALQPSAGSPSSHGKLSIICKTGPRRSSMHPLTCSTRSILSLSRSSWSLVPPLSQGFKSSLAQWLAPILTVTTSINHPTNRAALDLHIASSQPSEVSEVSEVEFSPP